MMYGAATVTIVISLVINHRLNMRERENLLLPVSLLTFGQEDVRVLLF